MVMKTFKQFLNESRLSDEVHVNPSLDKVKAIAKRSDNNQARFVIDRKHNLHVADASNWLHRDIVPPKQQHHIGFINHHGHNQFSYEGWKVSHRGRLNNGDKHPIYDRFDKHKIERNPENLHEDSSAHQRIHLNTTVAAIKNLTQTSGSMSTKFDGRTHGMKQWRFLIDKHDKLHAGDGRFHVHSDIAGEAGLRDKDIKHLGYVTQHPDKKMTYAIYGNSDDSRYRPDPAHRNHPIAKKLEKVGIKHLHHVYY